MIQVHFDLCLKVFFTAPASPAVIVSNNRRDAGPFRFPGQPNNICLLPLRTNSLGDISTAALSWLLLSDLRSHALVLPRIHVRCHSYMWNAAGLPVMGCWTANYGYVVQVHRRDGQTWAECEDRVLGSLELRSKRDWT
jgi:hypothetical protein